MNEERPRIEISVERIDADAVCERCGNVNPEDTLLCKTCGNNLRDQRVRRVTRQQEGEIPGLEPARTAWVGKVIGVLGIVLILAVAINVDNIAGFLAGTQSNALGDPESYWTGPDRQAYATLLRDLASHPVTAEEGDLAIQQPISPTNYDGRYVLMQPGAIRPTRVGQAIVRTDGDRLLFAAQLVQAEIEIRGEGHLEGTARIAARDTAGVKIEGKYYRVSGFAQKLDTGGFECLGLTDANEDNYSILAYQVP